mgnify:CR=1 FL=1
MTHEDKGPVSGTGGERVTTQESARRLTIGMPVMSLGDPYTDALIQGAARCAAARDVNLVVMLLDGFDALDYPAEHAEEVLGVL